MIDGEDMKTKEQLIQAALKTQDPSVLFSLLQQAIDLADFHASKVEFAKVREVKLKQQIERQTEMIANLEKTLWKK